MFVKHFEELISLNHLTVCRRIYKRQDRAFVLFCIRKCGSQDLALGFTDTEIYSCNGFKAVDGRLKYLI